MRVGKYLYGKIASMHILRVLYVMMSRGTYKGTGMQTDGSYSARYCYSVWLRHLAFLRKSVKINKINTVAELGPGNSLGIGIAALLTGANNYYALDIVKYSNNQRNVLLFEELCQMLHKREDIPGEDEFPTLKPYLKSYQFPGDILNNEYLKLTLHPRRIEAIRNALLGTDNSGKDGIQIKYYVPWYDKCQCHIKHVDLILSQAVLEHVDDLDYTYESMAEWLKPGGIMSHQIDFKSHGTSKEWNGHWAYSDLIWSLMVRRKNYLINRTTYSSHIYLLNKYGFEVKKTLPNKSFKGIDRSMLAPKFKNISDEDLITSGAYILSKKRN